ncbi:MAG TPA: hypothetical protein VD905_04055 [Flavobacteriales bacterium]|nr:hypothetical protein [Flavobacteriales bacterium]
MIFLYVAALLFYILFTWYGIKYRLNRVFAISACMLVLTGMLYCIKVVELDPVFKEAKEYKGFFTEESTSQTETSPGTGTFSDKDTGPFLLLPFLLPFIFVDLLFNLLILISILFWLAMCTVYFMLATSSILGFLCHSVKVAVLSFLTQCFFVGGYLLSIRISIEIFSDLEINYHLLIGFIGAFGAAPVPVATYFLWPHFRKYILRRKESV